MKTQKGLDRMREILGSKADQILENFKDISPEFARYVSEFAYGDFYSRTTLSDKTKEVAAVASLIGQGKTGVPLRSHIGGMLNVGWKQNEVLELIIFLIPYVGFPSAVEALFTAQEVFNSKKKS